LFGTSRGRKVVGVGKPREGLNGKRDCGKEVPSGGDQVRTQLFGKKTLGWADRGRGARGWWQGGRGERGAVGSMEDALVQTSFHFGGGGRI